MVSDTLLVFFSPGSRKGSIMSEWRCFFFLPTSSRLPEHIGLPRAGRSPTADGRGRKKKVCPLRHDVLLGHDGDIFLPHFLFIIPSSLGFRRHGDGARSRYANGNKVPKRQPQSLNAENGKKRKALIRFFRSLL